jgi:cell division septal protein FtsQ
VTAEGDRERRSSAIERLRERKERHKQRGKIFRVVWVIFGSLIILAGLALSLPGVPGPGLLIAAFGLGMLALEFDRAERLLEKVLVRLEPITDRASKASTTQKVVFGLLAVAVATAVSVAVTVWGIPYLGP